MYSFGTLEDQIEMLLDYVSAEEHIGPKRPIGTWQDMTQKQQEVYFVYLRVSLERCSVDPIISEEAIGVLYQRYIDLFTHLANRPGKLRTALDQGTHRFLGGDKPEILELYQKLVQPLSEQPV